jgi:hypothetical protein
VAGEHRPTKVGQRLRRKACRTGGFFAASRMAILKIATGSAFCAVRESAHLKTVEKFLDNVRAA